VPVVVEYRQQDEYCEWKTERDAHGNVRRITFTSESPEYWQFLESVDPSLRLIAALYTKLLGETVLPGELMWPYDVLVPAIDDPSGWAVRFPAHSYNLWNDWNVHQGIVHCTHPDNTLMKAATLVASASILRKGFDGNTIEDSFPLLCAGGFGDPNRESDPAVGFSVNSQVRLKREVSVASPAGAYMGELPLDGITASDGELVPRVVRRGPGDDKVLRLVLAAPEGHLCLDGQAVRNGGQIARRLTMNSAIVSRARRREAPKPREPVAQCVMSPTRPGYYGVFFTELDWPSPWIQPPAEAGERAPAIGPRRVPTPPAHGPVQPAAAPRPAPRLDTRMLHVIGTEQALDARGSRWSRWSRLSRWSGPLGFSGPTRWSRPG
jgi:hypothetical protein